MQDIITQRFIQCHKELLEKGVVRSSRQFALSLDYLPQSLSEILKGRRNVTVELTRKLVEHYKICPKFLYTGQGKILPTQEDEAKKDVLVVVADHNNNERIVHVPYAAQAGYGGQLTDPEYISELPTFTLPDQYFQSGTFRSFDVSGDSMEPTLFEGERVVCSFTEKDAWKHSIKSNHVYVVITQDDIVVKRVENKLQENGCFILNSDNEYYPPRIVPGDEVLELWSIKLKISHFMSSPKNIRNGLHVEMDELRNTLNSQNQLIQSLNSTIEKMLRQNRSR